MANNLLDKQGIQEIDLLKLLTVLWKRAWIIVTAAIAGGALFFIYTFFFITPMYQSSALLYVNNNSLDIGSTKLSITSGDINASNSLIDTYIVILKSRTTLERVIEEGELPYSYEQLSSEVTGSSEGNTPVFKITVSDPDPKMAAFICNRIVEVMVDERSGISGIVEGSSVNVIDYAVIARSPSSPSYLKNTAIGMLIGFVISCGFIILSSLMDTTIREEEFLLEKYQDIPVLGTIPDLTDNSTGGYYSFVKAYAGSSNKVRQKSNTASASSDASKEKKDKNKGSEA
ncbi:MAG: hypothetical protein K6E12_00035 [Saccharofermentans sp.]|nr:hypothetical protein [Saccharofermentans sp.]